MSEMPLSSLELQAARERERLHDSMRQLKEVVREKVDPNRMLRQHMAAAALVTGLGSLVFGYLIASSVAKA